MSIQESHPCSDLAFWILLIFNIVNNIVATINLNHIMHAHHEQ